jgi:glycosyltransferase involved in cell wall biosynthesis
MNILLVSPYLPHPHATHGTGVFMYGLLQQITQRHRVTLLSFCDEQEERMAAALKELPLEVHIIRRVKGRQKTILANGRLIAQRLGQLARSMFLWEPYYVAKYRDRRMARCIRELTRNSSFDIVQMEFAYMGQYAAYVQHGRLVLHEHDVTYRPAYRRYRRARSLLKRAVLFLEWCRWARYEPRLAGRFDHVFTVTEQDRLLLGRLSHSDRISYLPRGIDIPERMVDYSTRERHSILFIGTFRHSPNVDAAFHLAEDILPLVLDAYPDTNVYIIGSEPPPALTAISARQSRLHVLGYVDAVAPYLRRCAVFVAPLRLGGGVKLKIIHAMAEGIPVVTTRVGIEGIDGIDAASAAIGTSPETLADHICRFFADPSLAARTGSHGRDAVAQHYSWPSVADRLERMYAQIHSGAREYHGARPSPETPPPTQTTMGA